MKTQHQMLRKGDPVEVRPMAEIRATLDEKGTLGGLPFMPEMIRFCGRRFTVSRRAEKTCVDLGPLGYDIREFRDNDVVILDDLLCTGEGHDGCGRACVLFWKQAWLRKVQPGEPIRGPSTTAIPRSNNLCSHLGNGHYFCQSTQLATATLEMSRGRKAWKCVHEVTNGNRGLGEMLRLVLRPVLRKVRRMGLGLVSGGLKRTPTEALALQPGDWVTVKSVDEIRTTLDTSGRNRGLSFGMTDCCGKPFRVHGRLERMIIETTGEMRTVENTVLLEGARCGCVNVLGGCPRNEFSFWREIWLKPARQEAPQEKPAAKPPAPAFNGHP